MKRRFFNFLVALSLVLCVATSGLFVHSGFRYVYVIVAMGPSRPDWEIGSARGRIYCTRVVHFPASRAATGWRFGGGPGSGPADWSWRFGGFDAYRIELPTRSIRQYIVPHYFVMLVLFILPTFWWMRWRQHPAGCCWNCGYDLRASPERCPECGEAVAR